MKPSASDCLLSFMVPTILFSQFLIVLLVTVDVSGSHGKPPRFAGIPRPSQNTEDDDLPHIPPELAAALPPDFLETLDPQVLASFDPRTLPTRFPNDLGPVDQQSAGNLPIFARFLERCEKIEPKYRAILMSSAAQAYQCVRDLFNLQELSMKIEEAIRESRGGLNDLFKDYCRKWDPFLECLQPVGDVLKMCLRETEARTLKSGKEASESVKDYLCEDGGNKIALFFGSEGLVCLNGTQNDIRICMEDLQVDLQKKYPVDKFSTVSDFEEVKDDFCQDYFMLRRCVVGALKKSSKCTQSEPGDLMEGTLPVVLDLRDVEPQIEAALLTDFCKLSYGLE